MASIIANVGAFITAAFGWAGDVLEVITNDVLLTIFVVAVPLVGIGIGLVKRLLRA